MSVGGIVGSVVASVLTSRPSLSTVGVGSVDSSWVMMMDGFLAVVE